MYLTPYTIKQQINLAIFQARDDEVTSTKMMEMQ